MRPTMLDLRRLQTAGRAKLLPEPHTKEEAAVQIEVLVDAILALQSLDDLGSREANKAADDEMLRLQDCRDELKCKGAAT